MDFKVGEKVVHPHHGVAEVMAEGPKEVAGHRVEVYELQTIAADEKVMVSKSAAKRLGLRNVISKKDAKKVLDVLRSDEVAVTSQPWNRRYRAYTEMLNSGSLFEVAKVVRDLYRLKSDKELSFGERRLLEKSTSLLVTELAVARKVKDETIESDIQGILG